MTYIIIALVVALALAPLTHFLPSKAQRRQAHLREVAAQQGMMVEFRSLPSQGSASERLPHSGIIYYGWRLRPSKGRERRRGAWIHEVDGWRSLGERVPVPAALAQLPPLILAASVDEISCGIYWQETGDEEIIRQIQCCLQAWASTLAP
ncbi:MAG: hypothetical protein ACK5ME_14025 [Parahaliea sp.]